MTSDGTGAAVVVAGAAVVVGATVVGSWDVVDFTALSELPPQAATQKRKQNPSIKFFKLNPTFKYL